MLDLLARGLVTDNFEADLPRTGSVKFGFQDVIHL